MIFVEERRIYEFGNDVDVLAQRIFQAAVPVQRRVVTDCECEFRRGTASLGHMSPQNAIAYCKTHTVEKYTHLTNATMRFIIRIIDSTKRNVKWWKAEVFGRV